MDITYKNAHSRFVTDRKLPERICKGKIIINLAQLVQKLFNFKACEIRLQQSSSLFEFITVRFESA